MREGCPPHTTLTTPPPLPLMETLTSAEPPNVVMTERRMQAAAAAAAATDRFFRTYCTIYYLTATLFSWRRRKDKIPARLRRVLHSLFVHSFDERTIRSGNTPQLTDLIGVIQRRYPHIRMFAGARWRHVDVSFSGDLRCHKRN